MGGRVVRVCFGWGRVRWGWPGGCWFFGPPGAGWAEISGARQEPRLVFAVRPGLGLWILPLLAHSRAFRPQALGTLKTGRHIPQPAPATAPPAPAHPCPAGLLPAAPMPGHARPLAVPPRAVARAAGRYARGGDRYGREGRTLCVAAPGVVAAWVDEVEGRKRGGCNGLVRAERERGGGSLLRCHEPWRRKQESRLQALLSRACRHLVCCTGVLPSRLALAWRPACPAACRSPFPAASRWSTAWSVCGATRAASRSCGRHPGPPPTSSLVGGMRTLRHARSLPAGHGAAPRAVLVRHGGRPLASIAPPHRPHTHMHALTLTPHTPACPYPAAPDMHWMLKVISQGHVRTFTHHRLLLLEQKFNLHVMLNAGKFFERSSRLPPSAEPAFPGVPPQPATLSAAPCSGTSWAFLCPLPARSLLSS